MRKNDDSIAVTMSVLKFLAVMEIMRKMKQCWGQFLLGHPVGKI